MMTLLDPAIADDDVVMTMMLLIFIADTECLPVVIMIYLVQATIAAANGDDINNADNDNNVAYEDA